MGTHSILLVPFLLTTACAQSFLNLDFEVSSRDRLWYWSTGASGYEYKIDTTEFRSGAQSLRIRNTGAPSTSLGLVSQSLLVDLVRGKHVRVNGWMKTAGVTGFATLWMRVDGPSGVISNDVMANTGPRGTTEWAAYAFERDVSPAATTVYLGVFLSGGGGTAWFDALQVEVDGSPIAQGPPSYPGEPTPAQIDWVTRTANPVVGPDFGQDWSDLQPLQSLIGDARIVALGEGTHGTSEFFRMKHRIIEYLANNMGFTIFSIEANMPEAYAVNEYVLYGRGDPKKLLKGMYFWTWNTQEVLDMIEWMRRFNESGAGRIQFTGFDMQTPDVAAQIARDFLGKADPAYAPQANRVYDELKKQSSGSSSFAVAAATFPLAAAAGKRVRYSGYIKSQGITTGYAGLWWRADGPNSTTLAFDNMSTRGATGTADWRQFEINLTVPANTTNINFGVLHAGSGTAWFDSLAVELDGVPYTGSAVDFDFESATPVGFSTSGAGYTIQLDSTVAHTGKQSLRTVNTGPALTKNEIADQCAAIVAHMESSRSDYLANTAAADIEWAIQNARVAAQAADLARNGTVRDPDMAQNVQWIIDQAPAGAKIVLWAHNFHVSRTTGAMGSYLAGKYGRDYVVFGFAFHEGSYTASGPQGVKPYDANPSFPGSAEYIFHQSGIPQFIVDVRQAKPDDPGSSWLLNDIQFRSIGALPADGFYITRTLTTDFDALIYFDHSSPSAELP